MKELDNKAGVWTTEKSLVTTHPVVVTDHECRHPGLVSKSGPAAQFAWEEFIFGKIRNLNTRAAYERAIRRFLKYSEEQGKELSTVSPRDVGIYLDGLDYAPASK